MGIAAAAAVGGQEEEQQPLLAAEAVNDGDFSTTAPHHPCPAVELKEEGQQQQESRGVIYEGWMEKRGAYTGTWRRRFFRLCEDGVLHYCGSDGAWFRWLVGWLDRVCVCVMCCMGMN